jgi:hypothetical protein
LGISWEFDREFERGFNRECFRVLKGSEKKNKKNKKKV